MGGVVGVGTDLVDTTRLAAAMERRPSMATRLFTPAELAVLSRGASGVARDRSTAGRFAAKEAVMKALGVGIGDVGFGEIEILGGRGEAPHVRLSGRALEVATRRHIDDVAISLTHEGTMAGAVAVASRRCACDQS
jgi:holo-[acyl-carrier protein] synthase